MRKLLMVAIGVVCSSSNGQGFASGEEIKVLSAVGMRQVLVELAPMFERATGHRLHLTFDSGAVIVRRIQSGEAADVILVPDDGLRQLAAAGRIAGESMTAVASSRVGVAVHAGAPRPDIASAAALRQTLLAARSVARPDPALGGSSGLHIQKTFERLGIADALAAKSILSSHPDREDEMPAARVARGEAEIALHQIQELLAVPGVVVIGPLPGELDGQFLFSAALVRGTGRTDAGRKLIAFLVTPRAREVIKRKGMQAASTETGGEPRLEQPFGSFATDWDEIDTAVEFIRSLRGDRALKVNLVGWSRGGMRVIGYAALRADSIDKVIALSPTRFPPLTTVPTYPTNMTDERDFFVDWDKQIDSNNCPQQVDPSIREALWQSTIAQDKLGSGWGAAGVRRSPAFSAAGWTPERLSDTVRRHPARFAGLACFAPPCRSGCGVSTAWRRQARVRIFETNSSPASTSAETSLEAGEDLMTIEIGDKVTVRRIRAF